MTQCQSFQRANRERSSVRAAEKAPRLLQGYSLLVVNSCVRFETLSTDSAIDAPSKHLSLRQAGGKVKGDEPENAEERRKEGLFLSSSRMVNIPDAASKEITRSARFSKIQAPSAAFKKNGRHIPALEPGAQQYGRDLDSASKSTAGRPQLRKAAPIQMDGHINAGRYLG
jgi:hypothetical protein